MATGTMATVFPFSAIVGQDEMKLALLIAAVDQKVGGVLAFGDRGAGKSTAVRALAALLPVTAHAHHVPGENHSILAGFSHPILGFDHLCAMLAVGLLAA